LGFGFDGCFWGKAVVADTWPLTMLLFALTLCLLMRWFFAQEQKRFLYAAAFAHGLTLSECQALIPATFALPFMLALGDRKLGREIFFGISVFLWWVLLVKDSLPNFGWTLASGSQDILVGVASVATLSWGILSFSTHSFFNEWRTSTICSALFLAGLSFYLLLPVFSMTTPPINWGYPRTVEGFFHVLSRGQYGSSEPARSFSKMWMQWILYGKVAVNDFGPIYLIAAAIPFIMFHKVSACERRWLASLLAVWFVISLLMLVALNPDILGLPYIRSFFAASHLVLALLAGYGMMLVVAILGRPTRAAKVP